MPLRLNSNNRSGSMNSNNCSEVTDQKQTFVTEICLRCAFDEKNEIPYWSVE